MLVFFENDHICRCDESTNCSPPPPPPRRVHEFSPRLMESDFRDGTEVRPRPIIHGRPSATWMEITGATYAIG